MSATDPAAYLLTCEFCPARGIEAEHREAVAERDEAIAGAERATALAERYGEAIVAISAALPNVNRARLILANLDTEESPS